MRRVMARYGDTHRYFASEDGKHYRGHYQDHAALKAHIEFTDQMVNGAPSRGNPNQWGYAGSIPMSLLWEWCQKTRTPLDVWARDEGGAKQHFLRWLKSEHPHLFPQQVTRARPQIVVPVTYRKRTDA
jgi:hypothetical protein